LHKEYSAQEFIIIHAILNLILFPSIKEKTVTETANEAAKEYGKVLRDQIEHVEQVKQILP
jgi:hypothetical protein